MSIATPIRHCGGSSGIVRIRHSRPAHSGASSQVSASVLAPRQRRVSLLLRAAFMIALAGVPLAASAAYKCADGNGHFTYQDVPCEAPANDPAANEAPAPQPAPAYTAPAATPAPTPATTTAAAPAPAAPAATAPAAAEAKPEPYLGDDQNAADPNAAADGESDATADDSAGNPAGDDAQADAADSAAARAALGPIFARLALRAMIWLALAGLVGYRATQRNRGFFKWSIMALVFSPALIYLILRLMGPADEMA